MEPYICPRNRLWISRENLYLSNDAIDREPFSESHQPVCSVIEILDIEHWFTYEL
jgi:hypothetical protein